MKGVRCVRKVGGCGRGRSRSGVGRSKLRVGDRDLRWLDCVIDETWGVGGSLGV